MNNFFLLLKFCLKEKELFEEWLLWDFQCQQLLAVVLGQFRFHVQAGNDWLAMTWLVILLHVINGVIFELWYKV